VIGLASFRVEDVIGLASGRLPSGNATDAVRVNTTESLAPCAMTVQGEDLVPYTAARLRRTLGIRHPVQ
jgi:hypothetical protein